MSSESELSAFLKSFSPISLHHRQPESIYNPWVFWSESEGCENNSSSADLGTLMLHDKIKSALYNNGLFRVGYAQFWAPVTIGGKRVLSTSGQPFAVSCLHNRFAEYRLNSEEYKYNIDADADADASKVDIEPEHMHMMVGGGPATAFLNCRTSINKIQGFLLDYSLMLPLCFPPQTNCIGVLEFAFQKSVYRPLADFLHRTLHAIKEADLDVFYVQDLIPYKTINGLKVAKDEIQVALKFVCESHNLALAQVWIPYKDKCDASFSLSLDDSQTKQLLAIKLTGYLQKYDDFEPCLQEYDDEYDDFEPYFSLCDVNPQAVGKELPLVALQDYESHYISILCRDMLVDWDNFSPTSAFAICLKSNNTGNFNYVFEFMWTKHSNSVFLLEGILLSLKRCLPGFKFASGAEIGDELDVLASGAEIGDELDVHNQDDETKTLRIFQRKSSLSVPNAPEKGKDPMVVDLITPSKVMCKTTPKVLPREVIEKQFGKTMKDAAKNLKVSSSTLKRKLKELGIPEWPGPRFEKRNMNDSSTIQINTNEEDSGAIEDTSTGILNKNVVTVKVEYEDDVIKFHLPISQATFENVEKEIGMQLSLSDKSYKLKYLDEDGDWILFKSDEAMADCLKSSRKSNRIVVRLRAISTTNIRS